MTPIFGSRQISDKPKMSPNLTVRYFAGTLLRAAEGAARRYPVSVPPLPQQLQTLPWYRHVSTASTGGTK